MVLHFILANCSLASGAVTGWTYKDDTPVTCDGVTTLCGPEYWCFLTDARYCLSARNGATQSPIDISSMGAVFDGALAVPVSTTTVGCSSVRLLTTNDYFEIDLAECPNITASYNGIHYTVSNLHLHSPSEQNIDGRPADAELHMVHKGPNGELLVIGLRYFSISM